MLANLKTSSGEAHEVHRGATGYFALFRKQEQKRRQQRLFRVDQIDQVLTAVRNEPDVYFSQASFFTAKSRRISAVAELGCAFVDIDCYKLGIEPDERMAQHLVDRASQMGLPQPTYIVASGRGLYVKWLFNEQLAAAQLSRWQGLQSVLIPVYRSLGSDAGVRDAARVLRVIESTNSASGGQVVRVLWSSGQRVAFNDLVAAARRIDANTLVDVTDGQADAATSRAVLRRVRDLTDQIEVFSERDLADFTARSEQHLAHYTSRSEPIMLPKHSIPSLNWQRFLDLRDLCLMRGGPRRGSRDVMLFWMANFLGLSGVVNATNFNAEIHDLARCFEGMGDDFRPLEDGSLNTLYERIRARNEGRKVVFKGAEYDPLYTPSNEHLIDLFAISPAEQARLSTLIAVGEKMRRQDVKNPGRAERREERQARQAEVIRLADEQTAIHGKPKVATIARVLGVDRSLVNRTLSKRAQIFARQQQTARERLDAKIAKKAALQQAKGQADEQAGKQLGETAPKSLAPQTPRQSAKVIDLASHLANRRDIRRDQQAEDDQLVGETKVAQKSDNRPTNSGYLEKCSVFSLSKEGGRGVGVSGAPSSLTDSPALGNSGLPDTACISGIPSGHSSANSSGNPQASRQEAVGKQGGHQAGNTAGRTDHADQPQDSAQPGHHGFAEQSPWKENHSSANRSDQERLDQAPKRRATSEWTGSPELVAQALKARRADMDKQIAKEKVFNAKVASSLAGRLAQLKDKILSAGAAAAKEQVQAQSLQLASPVSSLSHQELTQVEDREPVSGPSTPSLPAKRGATTLVEGDTSRVQTAFSTQANTSTYVTSCVITASSVDTSLIEPIDESHDEHDSRDHFQRER